MHGGEHHAGERTIALPPGTTLDDDDGEDEDDLQLDGGAEAAKRRSQTENVTLLHLLVAGSDGSPARLKIGTELVILKKQRGPMRSGAKFPLLGEGVLLPQGSIMDSKGATYETPTEWYRAVSGSKNRSGWKMVRLRERPQITLRAVKADYVRQQFRRVG
jgi:hypothetical protein